VGPEEAGLFSQREIEKMKGSNRCTGISPIKPIMLLSFMPGGRSHSYLKRIFIDGAKDRSVYEANEDPGDFAFVEAVGWDNVEWCRKLLVRDGYSDKDFYSWTSDQRKAYFLTSEYGRKLLSITDKVLRDAWLDGNWDAFEGLIFPELSDTIHNLDQFTNDFQPKGMRLVSAIDWADSGIAGGEQAAVDTEENLFFFDEYHERNRTVREHSIDLIAMLNSHGRQDYTLMDLPVNNINQDNLFSIQDAFRRGGLHTVQAYRANIQIGLDLLKDFLRVDPNRVHPFTQQLGSPRLFISRRKCPALWAQMKNLQRSIDAETGKVKYVGEDDNLDPARYLAMSRPKPAEITKRAPEKLPVTTFEQKAARSISRFDKSFGKDPSANEWFGKS